MRLRDLAETLSHGLFVSLATIRNPGLWSQLVSLDIFLDRSIPSNFVMRTSNNSHCKISRRKRSSILLADGTEKHFSWMSAIVMSRACGTRLMIHRLLANWQRTLCC